jgi:hypothetical protein
VKTLAIPAVVALVGLGLIGLVGGDPRAARDIGLSSSIDLAGLALAVAVGALAWWLRRRRNAWFAVPTVFLAIFGGLCGWIAGAEFTLEPDAAVHLKEAPGRVAFMLAITAIGMALPSSVLSAVTARGRART